MLTTPESGTCRGSSPHERAPDSPLTGVPCSSKGRDCLRIHGTLRHRLESNGQMTVEDHDADQHRRASRGEARSCRLGAMRSGNSPRRAEFVGRVIGAASLVASITACGAVPSADECAREWNTSPPEWHAVNGASGSDIRVVLSGWTDKAGDAGCAVVIVQTRTGDWTSFSNVPARTDRWDSVSGAEWGVGNPIGGPTAFNARVDAAGRVVLAR